MADYVFVGSSVLQTAGQPRTYTAGEELEAGLWVYLDTASGKVWKANRAAQDTAQVVGITLAHAFTDQPVPVALDGTITSSTSLAHAGKTFILSNTPGVMADAADVPALTQFYTLLAYSSAVNDFTLVVTPSGIARS